MEVKGITDLLENLEDGQLEVDLTDELSKIVKAVGKMVEDGTTKTAKGTLSITLDIVNEQGVFYVLSKTKTSLPVMPRRKSIYYKTDDGNLITENPNQLKLPIAAVQEMPRIVKNA